MPVAEIVSRRTEDEVLTPTFRYVGELPRRVDGRRMHLYQGHTPELVTQLVQKSLQPHIVASTPKDSQDTVRSNGKVRPARFKSPEHFDAWYEKGRSFYSMLDERGDLGGIIWYGEEACEHEGVEANHTFAVRHYEGYQGKGMGRSFMAASLMDYMLTLRETGKLEDFKGIWLETDTVNEDARALYGNFGFAQVADDGTRVTMVLSPEAIPDAIEAWANSIKGDMGAAAVGGAAPQPA